MRAWHIGLVGCFALALASAAGDAAAAPPAPSAPSAAPGDERADLERQLSADYASLSASDCATACRALASMERAADRICALSPGRACDDARAKVQDAKRKVHEQCPTCQLEAPREHQVANAPVAPPAASPASERPRGGGCAGCATSGKGAEGSGGGGGGGDGGGGGGAVTLIAFAALLALRRPRQRRAIVHNR